MTLLQVGALMLVGACNASDAPTHRIGVDGRTVRVEVVATPADRARGLMHRDDLPDDQGMLFIYPDEAPRGFWMKDTRIPLSIAFADRHGTIVRIADMTPWSLERVSSLYPAMYALEMNQGWFEAQGVEKGDKLTDLPIDVPVE